MRKFWACLMLVGFVISVIIHFSIYTLDINNLPPHSTLPIPFILLHTGAVLGAFSLKRASSKPDMKATLSHVPKWAHNLAWTFGTYAVINFLLNLCNIFTSIGAAENTLYKPMLLVFSGHWMAFYITSAMSYWFSPQKAKKSE